jgi:hypothetical protein
LKLVYYSLVAIEGGPSERQWVHSARSLRQYNRSIPVYLFVYNAPGYETLIEADRLNVFVVLRGDYRDCFAGLPPVTAAALSRFPTLHKFLSLSACPSVGLSQILFIDCDTFFFGDVGALFERYSECHFYAREEPNSRRSAQGYQPGYLDEDMLYDIARVEGCGILPPYNTGVCLFNYGIWHGIAALSGEILSYAWRLLVGVRYRAPLGPELDEQLYNLLGEQYVSESDRRSCIVYPSSNSWIFDEIALWLVLGRIPGLAHDVLLPDDVLQNGEFSSLDRQAQRLVMAHYYSGSESQFFAHFGLSMLKTPKHRASLEIFAPPPYRLGYDHDYVRPPFRPLFPLSSPRLPRT